MRDVSGAAKTFPSILFSQLIKCKTNNSSIVFFESSLREHPVFSAPALEKNECSRRLFRITRKRETVITFSKILMQFYNFSQYLFCNVTIFLQTLRLQPLPSSCGLGSFSHSLLMPFSARPSRTNM